MAQKIPEEFDGILAGAPAINWAKFVVAEAWGYAKASQYGIKSSCLHFLTTKLTPSPGTSPPLCVFDAITNASVAACDGLDGVEDGVIALPGLCEFDPSSLVGTTVECPDMEAPVMITEDMANLVRDIWTGPVTADNQSLWYGRSLTPISLIVDCY